MVKWLRVSGCELRVTSCGRSAFGAGGGAPRKDLGLEERPESIRDLRSGSRSPERVASDGLRVTGHLLLVTFHCLLLTACRSMITTYCPPTSDP